MMNWQTFGPIGYAGLLLGCGAVVLWTLWKVRPSRRICQLALALAVVSFVCARVNSSFHVDRIQPDPAEQLAEVKKREDERKRMAMESRSDEVAQIRFAEDSAGEFLDEAGMDEADLKYMSQFDESETPEWKKEKRERSGEGAPDDSLESRIGGAERTDGVESEELADSRARPAILMSSASFALAQRLDGWNLRLTVALVAVGLVVLAIDYLRRFNLYREATSPLPLPSAWPAALTPLAPLIERPHPPRRDLPDELAWLLRRGDSFLHLGGDPRETTTLRARLEAVAARRDADLIHLGSDLEELSDEFVFEALWYGRASFLVDRAERAEPLLRRIVELAEVRRSARARARQAFHIVWSLPSPPDPALLEALERAARATGFSILICRGGAAP